VNTTFTDSETPRGTVVIAGASTGISRACALSMDALGFRVLAGTQCKAAGNIRELGYKRCKPFGTLLMLELSLRRGSYCHSA
jgi:NADP-dependent 3-hydroxy acid dehydrogenase YdfG